jgi:uncharacterized repeat protein (TIGR01451 family)
MKKILVAASMMLLGFMSVQAAGTLAGTDINNSVTLSYDVGGVTQTAVPSNVDYFEVDRKIDLIVDATNTPLDVTPSSTDQNLSFLIVNEGNDQDTFSLAGTYNIATDDFDPTNCAITDTAGTVIASVTLAADANVTVYVSCDIPAVGNPHVVDDDNGTVSLLATSSYGNDNGSADVNTSVQNVWADGPGTDDANLSGSFSDRGTYHIVSADLSASKTSCIIDDPFNGTNNPKRIPGATVRYAIEVINNGSANASNVTTTDGIDSHLTIDSAEIRAGACNCGTPAGASAGTATIAAPNVTLDFATINAGDTECAYITTTVN